MKAFVQTINNQFSNINFLTAYQGFYHYGYEVETFEDAYTDELITKGEITKETPVFAGIPIMNIIYERLGIEMPVVPYYPTLLKNHLGRKVNIEPLHIAISEVLNTGVSKFIKPLEESKKTFNGFIAKEFKDFFWVVNQPQDQLVWVSDIVSFITEYRCFVNQGKVLDIRRYKGGWENYPNPAVIKAMVAEYTSAPVAYSLDVGVTADGYTKLVECNDATSLGCYGLDKVYYGKMLIDRWKQIMDTK